MVHGRRAGGRDGGGLDAGRGDRGHRARAPGPLWRLTPQEPAAGRTAARARRPAGLRVAAVEDAAERAGLLPGDCIARIDGEVPVDVLDLELAAADDVFTLTVLRDGHPLELAVAAQPGEWHGISLDHGGLGDEARVCRNRCRFCFVDQVPRGLRPALYVKDDDYRLSFLHGNFTTLTNLSDADVERILDLRLSPLYVSLHAWDDAARVRLMGRAAAGSRETLELLAGEGWSCTSRSCSARAGTTATCCGRPSKRRRRSRASPTWASSRSRWPPRATCVA